MAASLQSMLWMDAAHESYLKGGGGLLKQEACSAPMEETAKGPDLDVKRFPSSPSFLLLPVTTAQFYS